MWNYFGFVYIIITLANDSHETDSHRQLGIVTAVIILLTAAGVLIAPFVVFGLTRVFDLVCYGTCKRIHHTWRLRKAISEYTPLNIDDLKST